MNIAIRLALVAACAASMASCSKDSNDDREPVPAGKEITFTGHDLEITYNGAPVYGKTATFNTLPDGTATITVSGADFDLTPYLGQASAMIPAIPTQLPTPGVLPGSPSSTFGITPDASGRFSGEGSSEYCTFSYSGRVDDSKLCLDLTDVELIDLSMTGTYAPATTTDASGNVTNSGFHFVWESSELMAINIFGPNTSLISIGDFVNMAMSMGAGVNPSDKVAEHMREISFGADGNVTMVYVADGSDHTSPLNVCQYVVVSPELIKAYINPAAIVASAARSRAEEDEMADLSVLIGSLAEFYVPAVRDGIPVTVDHTAGNGSLSLYLDRDFMMPLLQGAGTVLESEAIQQLIINEASEKVPAMAPMWQQIVPQFPAVVKGTTRFEAGLDLVRK